MGHHEESYTSAAIDGARIACVTAEILVSLDSNLPEDRKEVLCGCIQEARRYLDVARLTIDPVLPPPSSLHTVGGALVVPPGF